MTHLYIINEKNENIETISIYHRSAVLLNVLDFICYDCNLGYFRRKVKTRIDSLNRPGLKKFEKNDLLELSILWGKLCSYKGKYKIRIPSAFLA